MSYIVQPIITVSSIEPGRDFSYKRISCHPTRRFLHKFFTCYMNLKVLSQIIIIQCFIQQTLSTQNQSVKISRTSKLSQIKCAIVQSRSINTCLEELGFPIMIQKISRPDFVQNFHWHKCEVITKSENKKLGRQMFNFHQCQHCFEPFSENHQSNGHCKLEFHTGKYDSDYVMKLHGSNINKTGFKHKATSRYSECVCNSVNCDQKVFRHVLYDLMVDGMDKLKDDQNVLSMRKLRPEKLKMFGFDFIETRLKINCGNHMRIKWSKHGF